MISFGFLLLAVLLTVFGEAKFFDGTLEDTHWCGPGNVSRGMYDIGPNHLVDICCRTHHFCYTYIRPNEIDYGLRNDGNYTVVSCECDQAFYDCLNSVNTTSAKLVLWTYGARNPRCVAFKSEYTCAAYFKPCEGYPEQERNLCRSSDNQCKRYHVEEYYVFNDSRFKLYKEQILKQQRQDLEKRLYLEQSLRLKPAV